MVDKSKLDSQLLKYFSLLAIANILVFGILSYTVDSELWSVTMAKYFGQFDHDQYSVYNKPVFYLILRVLFWLPLSNLQHVVVAKGLFVLNALALCVVSYRVFERLTQKKEVAWFGLLFLALHPTWIIECFRIRADLLAMTFSLLALLLAFGNRKNRLRWIVLCLGLSFLSTPKAVIWNFPILILMFSVSKASIQKKEWLRIGAACGVLILVALGLYASVSSFRIAYDIAWLHFQEMLDLYSSQGAWGLGPDWLFVVDSIEASPILWGLIFLAILSLPWLTKQWDRKSRIAIALFYIALITIFIFYSPKLAFLWASLLPLMMLPFVLLASRIYERLPYQFRLGFLICFCFFSIYRIVDLYQEQNGLENYQFISEMDHFIGEQKWTLFDSMGLLPRASIVTAYAGPGDAAGTEAGKKLILANPPDIVYQTARIRVLMPNLEMELLNSQYTEVQEGLWLKKSTFGEHPKTVTTVDNISELFNQRLLTQSN